MKVLLGLLVILPVVLLVAGTVRGRVRLRSCCALPPQLDGRMSSAYAGSAAIDATQDGQTAAHARSAH